MTRRGMSKRWQFAAGAVALALVATACGGDDDDDAVSDDTTGALTPCVEPARCTSMRS